MSGGGFEAGPDRPPKQPGVAKKRRKAPMSVAERQRRFRIKAVRAGLCSVCGQRPPRAGLATCEDCNEKAKGRVYKSRGK